MGTLVKYPKFKPLNYSIEEYFDLINEARVRADLPPIAESARKSLNSLFERMERGALKKEREKQRAVTKKQWFGKTPKTHNTD